MEKTGTGLTFSEVNDIEMEELEKQKLIDQIDKEIKINLISQFGLSRIFDDFKDGSGVDTIHNAREDAKNKNSNVHYTSEELRKRVHDNTTGKKKYNKDIARKLHGGSSEYRAINKRTTEEKKKGLLIDPYTGKRIKRNGLTDLEHLKPTKTAYEDAGRELSGLSTNEVVNNPDNLVQTDRSINRSMGAKSKAEYVRDLEENKKKWREDRKKILNDSSISEERKRIKLKNIDNRLKADPTEITKASKIANKKYNQKINKAYYGSGRFKIAVAKESLKTGSKQMMKKFVGVILYDFGDLLIKNLKIIVDRWKEYACMNDRISDYTLRVKNELLEMKNHLNDLKLELLDAFSGSVFGKISEIFINTVKSTCGKFGKLLSDFAQSMMGAVRILFNKSIEKKERIKQALKLVSTAILASVIQLLVDKITKVISIIPILQSISDVIGTAISAIFTGIVTVVIVYAIDNFGKTVKKVSMGMKNLILNARDGFNTFKNSNKPIELEISQFKKFYLESMAENDEIYQQIMKKMYDEYASLNRLQDMAFDFNLPIELQFKSSIKYANAVKADENKIRHNLNEIDDFFLK